MRLRPLHVFPSAPLSDAVNRLLAHAVFSAKFSEASTVFQLYQNLLYLCLGKLGCVYVLATHCAFRMCVTPVLNAQRRSSLRDLISIVIQAGSKKEMVRVYARRVIATVTGL